MHGHDITVSGVETGGFFLDNLDGWMDVSGMADNAHLPAFASIRLLGLGLGKGVSKQSLQLPVRMGHEGTLV
jgi:hypothetical protein